MAGSKKERSTKRRGNKEGSISQRGSRWRAVLTVGVDEKGRRIRKEVTAATKTQALAKLDALKSEAGWLDKTQRYTVTQLLDQWLAVAKPALQDGTLSNYDRAIRRIKPRIGGIRLDQLEPLHVQSLYSKMAKDGHSSHQQRLVHIVLNLALARAVKWKLIKSNVCDAVDIPKPSSSPRPVTLSKAEVEALFKAVEGDRLEALYVVAVQTGMRLGELLGLEWNGGVNLEAGYVQVTQSLSEVHGKLKIKEPKTESSRRRIDLPELAIDSLRRHRELMLAEGHGSRFAFVNLEGGWWRRSNFYCQSFKPALARASLPNIRFHDLRHTSATLLMEANEHPSVVQERLGHSQVGVTLGTYSHVVPTMQRGAATKFNEMFRTHKGLGAIASSARDFPQVTVCEASGVSETAWSIEVISNSLALGETGVFSLNGGKVVEDLAASAHLESSWIGLPLIVTNGGDIGCVADERPPTLSFLSPAGPHFENHALRVGPR